IANVHSLNSQVSSLNSQLSTLKSQVSTQTSDFRLEDSRQIEAAAFLEQRLPQVAQLRHARGDVHDREVLDADPALDLFPRDRRRDRRLGTGPWRVDGRQRSPPRILVVVHEHTPPRP